MFFVGPILEKPTFFVLQKNTRFIHVTDGDFYTSTKNSWNNLKMHLKKS